MRYRETKEQSSELLRLALPLMARQSAAYHPVSYSLWYEHVGGINPPLSAELSTRLMSNAPLSDDDVYRLHARHIYARDVEMLESLQRRLQVLLEDTAQAARAAGEDNGRFGQRLRESQSELTKSMSAESVRRLIAQVLSETVRMETMTLSLSQELQARAHEVRTLTEQLNRAQTEALLDPLCGLHNRRGLERVAAEIAASEAGFAGVALVLADVDHFKQVNDTHGHLLGDKVLRSIADSLRANIKGRDVAARTGGEEFALLLPQTTLAGAQTLAEQIRAAVARGRIRKDNGKEVIGAVTLSLGVAVAQPEDTLETLMARADSALYRAKRTGRNRVCVSAEELARAEEP